MNVYQGTRIIQLVCTSVTGSLLVQVFAHFGLVAGILAIAITFTAFCVGLWWGYWSR